MNYEKQYYVLFVELVKIQEANSEETPEEIELLDMLTYLWYKLTRLEKDRVLYLSWVYSKKYINSKTLKSIINE